MMSLWGLPPQLVAEVAKSATGFYDYQKKQEISWLSHQISMREKKLHQCQNHYKTQFVELKNKFNTLKVAREQDQSEFQRAKTAYKTLHENYGEKCRQLRKFEQLYNALRSSQDNGGTNMLTAFSPARSPLSVQSAGISDGTFAVPTVSPSQIAQSRERRRLTATNHSSGMTPPSPVSMASVSPVGRSFSRHKGRPGGMHTPRHSPHPLTMTPRRSPNIRAGGRLTPRRSSGAAGGGFLNISGGGGGDRGPTPKRRRRRSADPSIGGTPALSSMFKRRSRRQL
eukprot:628158_1